MVENKLNYQTWVKILLYISKKLNNNQKKLTIATYKKNDAVLMLDCIVLNVNQDNLINPYIRL